MKSLRNILVVVDPSRAEQPAIAKVARLANRVDSHILLFACETPSSKEARFLNKHRSPGSAPLPIDIETLLQSFSEPLRAEGIDVDIECTTAKHLYPAILKRACASGIDLLVKDTHHHSLTRRAFLTNTDWHLIRGCGVPVLLTKSALWKERPIILAALDPNHENDKPAVLEHHLLEWGSTLRTVLGGTLHAAHAYIPAAFRAAAVDAPLSPTITPEMITMEETLRKAQLQQLTAKYDVPQGNLHLEFGSAVDAIPRVAMELDADIVTMGAISRSSAELFLIGHTAERVLERLESDVLVVKPPDLAACLPW